MVSLEVSTHIQESFECVLDGTMSVTRLEAALEFTYRTRRPLHNQLFSSGFDRQDMFTRAVEYLWWICVQHRQRNGI